MLTDGVFGGSAGRAVSGCETRWKLDQKPSYVGRVWGMVELFEGGLRAGVKIDMGLISLREYVNQITPALGRLD